MARSHIVVACCAGVLAIVATVVIFLYLGLSQAISFVGCLAFAALLVLMARRVKEQKVQISLKRDLVSRAEAAYKEKKYAQALDLFRQAAVDLRKKPAGRLLELAKVVRYTGHCYIALGQYSNAANAYEHEMEIRQKAKPSGNIEDIVWCYHNLGLAYEWQKRYQEAIAQYEEGLRTGSGTLPANHSALTSCTNAIDRARNSSHGIATSIGELPQIRDEDTKTLDDVAGCDEAVAKFRMVAKWIKDARAYKHFGAKLPKGVLLYGPPGTGKTLLARAVAGEVEGNFFQATASEFIEMYVGVGASRVRALFEKAKSAYKTTGKPSIVFIDELDAVGKKRSSYGLSGDGERDQTVNQLLSCIQGFDPNNGTLVIAATNRPETLDPALTRSGRFDFKIEVTKPDRKGRKAIFMVHARNVELEPGIDREDLFDKLARRAYDFTGADIELAINEAVTRAANRNAPSFAGKSEEEIVKLPRIVTREDLEAGVDQVMYGEMIRSRVRTDKERRTTAIHEIGHAAVPTVLSDDPVSRITIVMTSKALGLMENPTQEDRYGWSKEQFVKRIKTMLAGRISEEELEGEVSTGASNDFERASHLARQMVGVFGMSNLGLISIPLDDMGFPRGRIGTRLQQRFDKAWRKIIDDCEKETRALIRENAFRIRHVASILLEEETMTGDRFRELWNSAPVPVVPVQEPQAAPAVAVEAEGSVQAAPPVQPEESMTPPEPVEPPEGEAVPEGMPTLPDAKD